MNFSPQNTSTLENLLAALRGGMDPSQGYSILADTVQQQQALQQQRQERMSGYTQSLLDLAGGGMPQAQTSSIMDMLTPKPGIPGQVQAQIDQAYPMPEFSPPPSSTPAGPAAPMPYGDYMAANQAPQQQLSPIYTNSPQGQAEQIQLAQSMQPPAPTVSQQESQQLSVIIAAIQNGMSQGMDPQEIIQQIVVKSPEYAGTLTKNLTKIQQYIAVATGAI